MRKKTLEDNNYDLRRVMNYPGTGPFRHVKRVDKEVWIMEKNRDYWNEGLPTATASSFTISLVSLLNWGRSSHGASIMPACLTP